MFEDISNLLTLVHAMLRGLGYAAALVWSLIASGAFAYLGLKGYSLLSLPR